MEGPPPLIALFVDLMHTGIDRTFLLDRVIMKYLQEKRSIVHIIHISVEKNKRNEENTSRALALLTQAATQHPPQ